MAQEPGFELKFPDQAEATFVPWNVGMVGAKDLKIIDRCTAMPLDEFAAAFEDPTQRGRGPMMLAMIGVSIRAANPDWSVERVMAIVDDLQLPEVTFISPPEEDADPLDDQTLNSETESPSSEESSVSSSAESVSSAIRERSFVREPTSSTSERSKPIQA
jgi:hypothetical protein